MDIELNWIGGATFILSIDNLQIAVDPVLCNKGTIQDYFWFKSERIEEPIFEKGDFNAVDLWLITHNHDDHLDEVGLSEINTNSKVVSNKNSSKKLQEKGIKNLQILDWKDTTEYTIKGFSITVEAIAAIHGINPLSALLAGKVNGYYLTISKGKEKARIYITSDTVYKRKIITQLKNRPIDLLIANMGAAKKGSWIMTLTLDSSMLEKMIRKLNPKTVVPVHYGTFTHYKEPVEKIASINDNRIKIVAVGSKTKLHL